MSVARISFPQSLANLIERLPSLPPSFILTRILNLTLHEAIRRGDLKAMYGKHIAIYVSDTGLRLHFTVHAEGFTHIVSNGAPDLSISAAMHDFYLLSTRKEDPDTLFFKRRLVVEGDTELGLVAKNALDKMDLNATTMLAPRNMLVIFKLSLMRLFKQ